MRAISEIYPQLISAKVSNIVIVPHAKPDADALGSAVAWALFWQKFGHKVKILSPTNWARFLDFLTVKVAIIDCSADYNVAQTALLQADYFFALDWSSWDRILQLESLQKSIKAIKILLDHHQKPALATFDYGISLPDYSSTSEIVLDQILQIKADFLDSAIATALYAGIIGDTGSFRFACSTPELHEKVAILLRQNITHSLIHQHLFDTNTPLKLQFLGHILSNRLDIRYNGRIALMWVTQEDITNYHIKTGDTEHLTTYLGSLQDLILYAVLTDRTNEIRLSMRSKSENYDMSRFVSKYFNGGGHKMAAGGKSNLSLEQTIAYFWDCVQREFGNLEQN